MFISLVAAVQAAIYLCAIPVNLALVFDDRTGLRVGSGVSAFAEYRAVRRARRSLRFPSGNGGPKARDVWGVLRRMRFERASLTGSVSLGDAALTALACGGIRALAGQLRGRARHLAVDVRPDFSAPEVRWALRGMVQARTGQIMLAVLIFVRGRILSWTSTRLKT